MRKLLFWMSLFLLLSAETLPKGAIQVQDDRIVYTKAPKPFPPVPMMILEGDPVKEGIYTFRIKVAPHARIPLHLHEKDERVTVLRGEICIGFADKEEYSKGNCIRTGGFYINPKGVGHYLWTNEAETLLQVTGEGPWGMQILR